MAAVWAWGYCKAVAVMAAVHKISPFYFLSSWQFLVPQASILYGCRTRRRGSTLVRGCFPTAQTIVLVNPSLSDESPQMWVLSPTLYTSPTTGATCRSYSRISGRRYGIPSLHSFGFLLSHGPFQPRHSQFWTNGACTKGHNYQGLKVCHGGRFLREHRPAFCYEPSPRHNIPIRYRVRKWMVADEVKVYIGPLKNDGDDNQDQYLSIGWGVSK